MSKADAAILFPTVDTMAACTDLYELTMAAGYFVHGMNSRATFELLVRKLPRHRAFLVTAGLEQALHYLQALRFSRDTIRYVRRLPAFRHVPKGFFEYLAAFRFTGDVFALPEGTVAFAGEPLLFVRAPIIEAQVVETFLLAMVNYQTIVATKAARVVMAAAGRTVVDFGGRRAHGPQAGVLAARAAFIGGCAATSSVLAGQLLGIPVTGTQAHSWIMAFPNEPEAFRKYLELFPDSTTLLIDTYDTVEGARRAAALGPRVRAVRLDSGDLAALSRRVRRILDRAGLPHVRIVASGDLNETRIRRIVRQGAPVDAFGVGTELVTSRDDPALSGVYKLVEIERGGRWRPAVKLSHEKLSFPNRKQVRRFRTPRGVFRKDLVCGHAERPGGEPLLVPVMRAGRIIGPLPTLEAIQARCREQIGRLPPAVRDLDARAAAYPVAMSPALRRAAERARPPALDRDDSASRIG